MTSAQSARSLVTALRAMASLWRDRKTDCSTYVRTDLIMHRVTKRPTHRQCGWKQAPGRSRRGSSRTVTAATVGLTEMAFSWKALSAFGAELVRTLPTPIYSSGSRFGLEFGLIAPRALFY